MNENNFIELSAPVSLKDLTREAEDYCEELMKILMEYILLLNRWVEYNPRKIMTNEQNMITATLSLTKDQWRDIIQHIMNDASMLEMGLCAQAGRDAVIKITSNALDIANKIKDATDVDIDLSEWKFIYGEKKW